jgi:hypothetical protein
MIEAISPKEIGKLMLRVWENFVFHFFYFPLYYFLQ